MVPIARVSIRHEHGDRAEVVCDRCGQVIGRIQILPPADANPAAWDAQLQGEIEVIAKEHQIVCSA
jgi:hypothetical protein